jgi:hypothetical protein
MPQCTAHLTSNPTIQCRRSAVRGCNVCIKHGAGAPQVRRAAAMRILELVDPALANLKRDLLSKDAGVRQKATFDVLDRAGLGAIDRLQLLNPTHDDLDLSTLSDEQLAALAELSRKIRGENASTPDA